MAPALLQAAALVLRAASTTCPTLPTCPRNDQCSYAANGVLFRVSCATDYYGGDLKLAHVSVPIHRGICLTLVDLYTGSLHECLLDYF